MPRSEERPHPPTPRRRREARDAGQVARSAELTSWVAFVCLVLVLPKLFHLEVSLAMGLWTLLQQAASGPRPSAALRGLGQGLWVSLEMASPLVGVYFTAAFLAGAAQVGLRASAGPLRPRLSRISPLEGARRIASLRGAWQLAKAIIKLVAASWLAWRAIDTMTQAVVGSAQLSLSASVATSGGTTLRFLETVGIVGVGLAAADYAYQRRQHLNQLRMTRQEMKEELRRTEGDPLIRQRIRAQQRKLSRLRMMAQVAKADVVAVNPTHVAVALAYNPRVAPAPKVVAKGADELAARIREEAHAHHVPVVSDPPLARALYEACEIDSEIPPPLYRAVARLLAFVMHLSPTARLFPVVHEMPQASPGPQSAQRRPA